ncbi:MAG TPA: hypothetical protein VMW42_01460 [Desulfatiglandales bacterium]|nr:hypothetical protein [Desulfatiglandales bacterium]
MKDYVKLILELIKMGKGIFKIYRKERNASKKRKIVKAIQNQDLVRLLELNLGRKPKSK